MLIPMAENKIPPASSHFQAIASMNTSIKEGARCLMKLPICCQTDKFGLKASNAKILTNKIAAMHKPLAVQCSNFAVSIVNNFAV